MRTNPLLFLTIIAAAATCAIAAPVTIDVPRHEPCNIFDVTQPVQFTASVRPASDGPLAVNVSVTDFSGETVWQKLIAMDVAAKETQQLILDVGTLDPGYYDLKLDAALADNTPVSHRVSFGAADLVHRTASEAREGGYRFGLKTWYLNQAWWRGNYEWNEREVVAATAQLGLQWTRAMFNQEPHLSTADLIDDFPMNVVLKVERFPVEFFDTDRYGPLDEWEKKHGKYQWTLNTVPKKEPYQQWLRGELAKLPPEQNVFEIWNEPWGKMSPEEFAEVCQYIREVIRELRPDAIIGPNTGMYSYDVQFIAAGGMHDMDMVALHPYTAGTPENKNFRVRIRNYHHFLKSRLGRDCDLYTTEYGWATAPEGDRVVSEAEQAQRTVRESLMLYAENLKTLIPHTMGQREHDRKDREHWFGFYRLNHEPKPVLLAYAACAKLIDGSRFIGDLWYGPGIGAMVFERGDERLLALWTQDEPRRVELEVDARQVSVIDMMGRWRDVATPNGKLTLDLSGDVTYVAGVGSSLAEQAEGPDKPLRRERWWPARKEFGTLPAPKQVTVDADLSEWEGRQEIKLVSDRMSPNDCSGVAYIAWDENRFYIAATVRDNVPFSECDPANGEAMNNGDEMYILLNPQPDRQVTRWGPWAYGIGISPTSVNGKAKFGMGGAMTGGGIQDPPADDPSGIQWAGKVIDQSWIIEAAIPLKNFDGFPAQIGGEIACLLQIIDVDKAGESRSRIPNGQTNPFYMWPLLVLE